MHSNAAPMVDVASGTVSGGPELNLEATIADIAEGDRPMVSDSCDETKDAEKLLHQFGIFHHENDTVIAESVQQHIITCGFSAKLCSNYDRPGMPEIKKITDFCNVCACNLWLVTPTSLADKCYIEHSRHVAQYIAIMKGNPASFIALLSKEFLHLKDKIPTELAVYDPLKENNNFEDSLKYIVDNFKVGRTSSLESNAIATDVIIAAHSEPNTGQTQRLEAPSSCASRCQAAHAQESQEFGSIPVKQHPPMMGSSNNPQMTSEALLGSDENCIPSSKDGISEVSCSPSHTEPTAHDNERVKDDASLKGETVVKRHPSKKEKSNCAIF